MSGGCVTYCIITALFTLFTLFVTTETEVIVSSFPECLLDSAKMFYVVCTDNNSFFCLFLLLHGGSFLFVIYMLWYPVPAVFYRPMSAILKALHCLIDSIT